MSSTPANFTSTKIIHLGSTAFRQPRTPTHCSFIHGYRLTAKLYFTATQLDENHWVFPFGELKHLKKTLEQQFDHTTCISFDDPELDTFKMLHEKKIIDLRIMPNGTGIERIAEWVCDAAHFYVQLQSDKRVSCSKVEVWEHEQNSVVFERQPMIHFYSPHNLN